MTGYRLVLEPAKGPLLLFALSLGLGLGLVAVLVHYRGGAESTIMEAQAQLQSTRTEIQALAYDVNSLEMHLADFRRLSSIGLIGDPDREVWVHNLETIYSGLKLPPTLRYSLSPPLPFAGQETAAPGAAPTSQVKALRYDLNVELAALHEGEFLDFVEGLQRTGALRFALNLAS